MSESEDLHQRLIDENHKHELSLLAAHKKGCEAAFAWMAERIEENRAAQCERGEQWKKEMEIITKAAEMRELIRLAEIATKVESLSYAILGAETMDDARDVVREAVTDLRRLATLRQIERADQEGTAQR